MKNYRLKEVVVENGQKKWSILEVRSENIMGVFRTKPQATRGIKRFRQGRGFNGFTPMFILRSLKP